MLLSVAGCIIPAAAYASMVVGENLSLPRESSSKVDAIKKKVEFSSNFLDETDNNMIQAPSSLLQRKKS